MNDVKMAQSETRFAELVWEHEPISSGELVKLCESKLSWKKSTTYTVLKNLCEKGILQNQNAMVTSVIKKDEFYAKQSRHFVEDTFGGSLPKFLSAFIGSERLNTRQADELKRLIDEYRED
ncbi:MAG: BlaI/MecI/CopY family transcriptional regulator [Herbinix sp.]|jgi:predicted transcriptional regulator|nr:BlaI/MecI/CopY family transcriptional regulator [Herbinix sp.]